ncbi:hypothetical protein Avbf_07855 [Armadillidium vulgare]|nr:hypothetical protein Avbf_07855 [Armadillidium vulgare]
MLCVLEKKRKADSLLVGLLMIITNLNSLSGQMLDRGDKKPIFVQGQTIVTDGSLKFVPGEFITDEDEYKIFVPGMTMPCHGKEEFIPGQVFQTEDGITFTPGQVIDTDEGPSFVPGKMFKTSDGVKKFVKGEMLTANDGKITFKTAQPEIKIPTIKEDLVEPIDENIIPNDDLQLVAVVGKDISGFVVKPTNTSNIQAGDKLFGDIVESNESVLFYLSGKLPQNLSPDSKIISGKLTIDETSQRFIPGKMISSDDEEHFVPGQLVKTLHGQEFIPGQFVETADGPKFVPGHSVMTSEGEKFIPGQVIVEEDGPKFVPGQIIQTKNGATFIPGQLMNTEKGKKFVPGQVIETKDGPRFVPGQVIETSEGPKFISGTIVETEDGLKYLPTPSSVGINIEESEEDSEISFQGFDVSPEEIRLLSHTIKTRRTSHAPITKEEGLIDSGMLKRLAADTMDIHGRTPEPNIKKKKKKGKITIDALDDDEEKSEAVKEDPGTTKVDVLKQLMKVGLTVSSFRKEKELEKLGDLLSKLDNYNENEAEIEAMKFINSQTPQEDLCELYIGNDEQLIEDILHEIGDIDDIKRNDEVTRIVNDAIKKCVTSKCDEQISELIRKISKDPDSLFTDSAAQILLTEAVGVVCVTGDVEVASLLEKFISQPTNPDCLKEDKDVLAVLRQLLVLNRIAERKDEVAKVLQELQEDPEGIKDRNKVRKFIREAKSLLLSEKKSAVKQFDVRHVASSKDIPKEIFEQIKEDKEEAEKFMAKLPNELFSAIMGDERCGGQFLKSLGADKTGKASREMDKFRKGMAVVIAKDNVQAVIPRIYARSIYYGIMPYLLIDEEGFKFFEKGLTGRKLAPSRVIENTWFQPDSYYQKSVLAQQITPSGMQYNLVFLGDSYQRNLPSLQYTSLLPSSEPKKISYLESQRDGSVTPLRRSSTPSRRFSLSSVHDYLPSTTDSFSRRNSAGIGVLNYSRGVSPVDTSSIYSSTYSPYSGETSSSNLNRSGTIGKLLDKYSRAPLTKELGYQKPSFTSSRYKSYDDEDKESSKDLKSYGVSNSIGNKYSTLSEESPENNLKDSYLSKDNYSSKGNKTLQRPFSDIYETDEVESPTSEKSPIRSSLIQTAKKNYDALSSNHRLTTPPAYRKESYTDRLRDWKSKQLKMDEDADEKPLKISHNRYESVLTGEDDDEDEYDVRLKKRSTPSVEKHSSEDGDLDDDFSIEKFRESLRQKYSQNIENLNKTYKTPSPPKTSRYKKASVEPDDHLEAYLPKTSRYKKASVEPDDDLEAYLPKTSRQMASEISKKYTGQEPDDTVKGNKWESSYGRENGLYNNGPMDNYASPYNYNMGQNTYYNQPMGHSQAAPYSSPYGYQPGYRGYGAGAPAYGYGGGMGMNMHTPNVPYTGVGAPHYMPFLWGI